MASKPMSNVQNFFVPTIEFNEIFAGLLRVWNYTREKGISPKMGSNKSSWISIALKSNICLYLVHTENRLQYIIHVICTMFTVMIIAKPLKTVLWIQSGHPCSRLFPTKKIFSFPFGPHHLILLELHGIVHKIEFSGKIYCDFWNFNFFQKFSDCEFVFFQLIRIGSKLLLWKIRIYIKTKTNVSECCHPKCPRRYIWGENKKS